ncbi:MAG: hypothetical protein SGPRY_007321, partial [Prymnesium sp.]
PQGTIVAARLKLAPVALLMNILQAFTPVFVVAMLYCTSIETPSRRVCFAVLMICVGTSIASAGEAHFNLIGLIIMLCAEICEATRLVLTQKLLNNLKFPAMEGLYYMAPICTVWMWVLASVIELPTALQSGDFVLISQHPITFIVAMFLGEIQIALASDDEEVTQI